MIQYNQSYIFSSAPENGAKNRSATGDSFQVQLSQPITLPREAQNATLEVVQADIWNTVPNISLLKGNNKFRFSVGEIVSLETITMQDGLYSVGALNSFLSRELVGLGYPADLINLVGDGATQKIIITFSQEDIKEMRKEKMIIVNINWIYFFYK